MKPVIYEVRAYRKGSKEPFRTMRITNHRDYELENTTEEFSTFVDDTWDEAQEEEEL